MKYNFEKMKLEQNIFVTRPSLPPLEEFIPYLEKIWSGKILTNNGPYHQQLEEELCNYLGVKYLSLFCNGTLALTTALQALEITGEVITTPYSFVATTHALWWNNIQPVFVDIEPDYFTLDPAKIEAAITPNTSAILPVHVYGNPCKVNEIQKIATAHGLKVIYDAAHAFGVKQNGTPILNYGDLSVMSFHATKVFTTFEGGAIVCHDEAMKDRIDKLKNFGFEGETSVVAPGINAKMNEMQAAFGLLQLKYVDHHIAKRKVIANTYRKQLKNVLGISCLDDIEGVHHSYSYFPILIDAKAYGKTRDKLYEYLKQHNIFGRRYFYPLISQFPPYRELDSAKSENLPHAQKTTEQVICLPIYPDMENPTVIKICSIIRNSAK